jgi:HEAT repeat protein
VVCLAAIGAVTNAGGPDVVKDIIPLFTHGDHRIRAAAIDATSRFDCQRHVKLFCECLKDTRWEVRSAAAHALGKAKDPSTMDLLVGLMKDQSSDVRTAAADALGTMGDPQAIAPLVYALKDNESEVRKMAVAALSRIDKNWAVSETARSLIPELRRALTTGDWAVRQAAASALEQLGERVTATNELPGTNIATAARRRQQAILSAFTELLRDTDADMRLAAVDSLGRLGVAETRSLLMTALSDADGAVKQAAAKALEGQGMV